LKEKAQTSMEQDGSGCIGMVLVINAASFKWFGSF
jgi:hypothetical protein